MITISSKGSFRNTERRLKRMTHGEIGAVLERYGQAGVDALSNATPVRTGETADLWDYQVVRDSRSYSIVWTNSHVVNGVNIAILIQYDHGTRNGGFVQGRDYINPAIRPIFDKIAADVWKAVTSK